MSTSFRNYVMAVDRVERRLRCVTAALDHARIKYAVIGGNAVAAWVAHVDPAATRSTKDIDLLVDQHQLEAITAAMAGIGLVREEVMGVTFFTDPDEPSVRSAVHLLWANQPVLPGYVCSAPSVDEVVRDPQGFLVVNLPALVRMKLTSFRRIDQVHIEDLLKLGMIGDQIRESLPASLQARLAEVERTMDHRP